MMGDAQKIQFGKAGTSKLCLQWLARLCFCLGLFAVVAPSIADTNVTLIDSYAGTLNFVGTQSSLRTQPNSVNACSVVANSTTAAGSNATTATLSGIPATATITAALLYWAGSSATPDYTVTFEGSSVTASRQYTSLSGTNGANNFFSGVVDVTTAVTAKRNGTYSFSGLTIDATTGCPNQTVLGGWALLVIYSDAAEEFRVLNIYEGFRYFSNSSISLTLSNFLVPAIFTNGRHAHITWDGDPTLSGGIVAP